MQLEPRSGKLKVKIILTEGQWATSFQRLLSHTGMPRLLWINKDATNLDAKDHLQDANSHAQYVTWKRRRRHPGPHEGPVLTSRSYGIPDRYKFLGAQEGEGGVKFPGFQSFLKRYPLSRQQATSFYTTSNPCSDSCLLDMLDPFMPLAQETRTQDRRLLHFYFFETGRTLYGHPHSSAYCPIRDRTAIFIQNSEVWLQWVLLSAEVYKMGRDAATKSHAILSRRAKLYCSMRELLARSPYEYDVLAHITLAAVTEDRIGSTAQSQKHLTAVKRLLHESHNHQVSVPITTLSVLLYMGAGPGAFETLDKLNTAIDSFLDALLTFQERQARMGASRILSLKNTATDSSDQEALEFFAQFVLGCQQIFPLDAPSPPSRGDVELCDRISSEDARQARARMGIIWILNRILHDLHESNDSPSIAFLVGLRRTIGVTSVADIKPLTMLLASIDYVARLGFEHLPRAHVGMMDTMRPRGAGDRRMIWWWECVDAVEALTLLPEDKRARVLQLCCSWLVNVERFDSVPSLTKAECDEIGQEMRLSWLMN